MTRKGKLIPSQGTPPSACHHGQHAHSKEGQWDGERWVVPFTSKLKQLARSCRLPLRSFCYSHFLFPIMTGTYGVYNLASVLCIHNETTLKCCNGFSLIWRSVCQPRPTKDTHPWSPHTLSYTFSQSCFTVRPRSTHRNSRGCYSFSLLILWESSWLRARGYIQSYQWGWQQLASYNSHRFPCGLCFLGLHIRSWKPTITPQTQSPLCSCFLVHFLESLQKNKTFFSVFEARGEMHILLWMFTLTS